MAFEVADLIQAGASNNSIGGGQLYTARSDGDSLGTMLASGYLDGVEDTLNTGDIVILAGSDGVQTVQVTNTAGVITTSAVGGVGTVDSVSGAGTASVLTALTLHTTSGGADVLAVPDGLYIGQRKAVAMLVDSTSSVVTPDTTLGAYTIITLLVVGDSCDLMWTGAAWVVTGVGAGAGTLPVIS